MLRIQRSIAGGTGSGDVHRPYVVDLFEALKEYNQEPESIEKLGNLVDEIVDVQVAMETLLLILGLDDEGRDAARARIYEKNRRRGYYEKKAEGENEQSV